VFWDFCADWNRLLDREQAARPSFGLYLLPIFWLITCVRSLYVLSIEEISWPKVI